MKGTLVNLNVNPCKMCMPMGVATAFYGIKKCMTILHGSQGCSTYIRRHMATHYNEPVDIASSSLTEEGTVYGGERSLILGLLNLIKVYEPEVIGVATTCLAETIGEDISRIINKFYEQYPEHKKVTIIPVSSAGYGGTQFEGYSNTLYQIIKSVPMDTRKNGRVNIVTGMLSPADIRYLKEVLESFQIDYILFPDLSENLDGGYHPNYDKLPQKGTDIKDIAQMAGADYTIELTPFVEESISVGTYLQEVYNVPCKKCNPPVGLRDNDYFIQLLSVITKIPVPRALKEKRARLLDAMIDGHKYNSEARAVIYGDPDFVYSSVRMCVENGVVPIVTATGTLCSGFKDMILMEIKDLMDHYFIDRYDILEDVDFQTLEELAKERKANVFIGNSDGRRMAEKLGVDLVRRGFPIHDRVGGQRLRMVGYEGSLTFLDDITNVIIGRKETGFREELLKLYYKPEGTYQAKELGYDELEDSIALTNGKTVESEQKDINSSAIKASENRDRDQDALVHKNTNRNMKEKTIEEKTATHPCFSCGAAHQYARMHLPIAPKCNISCNYCVRKYDCPNESRPGVTTHVLNPMEALHKFLEVKEKVSKLSVIGIAGPGDALANFKETKRTLELIREKDADITFCLSTNGLMLPQYADDLVKLGVSHVTVTMNAIDPTVGAQIYKYVDYMGVKYYGETGAAILLSNQLAGIKMLTEQGIVCKVNIVMLKGINDYHIPDIVKKVKELGGSITNIMPLIPVKGSVFENLPLVSKDELMAMRSNCGETLKQMFHCRQCRADAIGTLGEELSTIKNPSVHIAVATKNGTLVDQHFGQVSELYIYEYKNGASFYKERRPIKKYCDGASECNNNEYKIKAIMEAISDCTAVITMRIGEGPKNQLKQQGIRVFTMYDRVEDCVLQAAALITDGIKNRKKDKEVLYDKA
ncbi:nitrogenase cofactor biosynthesis protein NifB [Mobilitalea sibirica]|uniref:Nitrogenase cofactor biosynthesis protein NifB n=1 Tax=Mobilitalea sibirica TaxID=1462919 RepID=A0A8J7H3J9_9FIRM|nr:nitrogenase cofactor biosynthesis protein NifB [Mobilitalea sibirica]MBH1941713.1 nitrogenase cofactor biosynthesis protein NifB [Mobilitalea sibirica]